jgi:hypothetical protein
MLSHHHAFPGVCHIFPLILFSSLTLRFAENMPLDKAAAARFINAALASADREFEAEQARLGIVAPTNSSHQKDTTTVANTIGGVHTRFAHIERGDTSTSESDEEDIAVFTGAPELQESHALQCSTTEIGKRNRSSLDPFIGN